MDYITLDFETASSSFTSPCSVGIVRVLNDRIHDEISYLINPEEPFSEYNISIHHITEDDVSTALTIKEIWPILYDLLDGQIVVSHNASFDISIIKACAKKFDLPMPNIKTACTLKIARRIWKEEVMNHKLNTIAEYLDVDLNHHNALSDARVCYYIIKRALRVRQAATLEELYQVLGLNLK